MSSELFGAATLRVTKQRHHTPDYMKTNLNYKNWWVERIPGCFTRAQQQQLRKIEENLIFQREFNVSIDRALEVCKNYFPEYMTFEKMGKLDVGVLKYVLQQEIPEELL